MPPSVASCERVTVTSRSAASHVKSSNRESAVAQGRVAHLGRSFVTNPDCLVVEPKHPASRRQVEAVEEPRPGANLAPSNSGERCHRWRREHPANVVAVKAMAIIRVEGPTSRPRAGVAKG